MHPRLVIAAFALVVATSAAAGLAAGASEDPCWNATFRGGSGNDVLRGTPQGDIIAGGGGNDVLIGGSGDDVLCGGPGHDKLRGQAGNDALYGGDDEREVADTEYYEWNGDVLSGGPGDDLLDVGLDQKRHDLGETGIADRITFVGSANGVTVDLLKGTATGEGHDTIAGGVHVITGTRHDDVLLGTNRADELNSGVGSDHLDGRGGNDMVTDSNATTSNGEAQDALGTKNTLIGGPGDDELYAGSGDDVLRGGPGNDNLSGGFGVDQLTAGPGNDQVGDYLDARAGARLDGGPGTDTLSEFFLYGPEYLHTKDVRTVGTGTIDLGAGLISSSVDGVAVNVPLISVENGTTAYGQWTLIGSDGPNELIPFDQEQPVRVYAGGGDDQLMGSFKHDVLDGGAGHDTDLWSPGKDERISIEKVQR